MHYVLLDNCGCEWGMGGSHSILAEGTIEQIQEFLTDPKNHYGYWRYSTDDVTLLLEVDKGILDA